MKTVTLCVVNNGDNPEVWHVIAFLKERFGFVPAPGHPNWLRTPEESHELRFEGLKTFNKITEKRDLRGKLIEHGDVVKVILDATLEALQTIPGGELPPPSKLAQVRIESPTAPASYIPPRHINTLPDEVPV